MWMISHGFLWGIAIAIPFGSISILTVRNTLHKGFSSGVATGLGATTSDIIYGFIAGVGISQLTNFFTNVLPIAQLLTSLIIFIFGVRLLQVRVVQESLPPSTDIKKSYLTGLLLTALNPLSIIFFLSIFTIHPIRQPIDLVLFIVGIGLGSSLWWILLCQATQKVGPKIVSRIGNRLNQLAGITLITISTASFLLTIVGG